LRRRGNASSAQGEHEDDHRAWHTPVESCMRALELGGASAMRVAQPAASAAQPAALAAAQPAAAALALARRAAADAAPCKPAPAVA
jgi:hypothetical protein